MATLDDDISVKQQIAQNLGLIYKALLQTFPNFVTPPTTATSSGTPNQVAFDATHFYVCIATNTWVRCALATF